MRTTSTAYSSNRAVMPPLPLSWAATGPSAAQALANENASEVLAFLAARPLHTVIMASMIRDNGVVSPLNRGTFYAYRDWRGQLEGVALIGHATLIESRSVAALRAFAGVAKKSGRAHMIMAEKETVNLFWEFYAEGGQRPRLLCRESMLEQRWPVEVREAAAGLQQATLDELELVMRVQAEMALAESGVNPMEVDPLGFRQRCARRIEQGRVWVWVEGGRLIFKADILGDTPEVIYLEGVWVNPAERGKGYGLKCMSQLGRTLLARTGSVCVLVNELNPHAQAFYRKAGYKLRSHYDTIFLQK